MESDSAALIVIDVLNAFDHEDAEPLIESVRRTLPAMCALVRRAQDLGVAIVYVNDNYGDWSAERSELSERALGGPDPSLIEPILPPRQAVFMTKARHSAFYETQLDYMLRSKDIDTVVLIGQVMEQCILYSALDAYVRGYSIVIPRDAAAWIHADLADAAVRMMERNMRAQVTAAAEVFSTAR